MERVGLGVGRLDQVIGGGAGDNNLSIGELQLLALGRVRSKSPRPSPLPHPPGAHVTPLRPRLFTYKFSSNQETSLSLSDTTGVVCIGSLVT